MTDKTPAGSAAPKRTAAPNPPAAAKTPAVAKAPTAQAPAATKTPAAAKVPARVKSPATAKVPTVVKTPAATQAPAAAKPPVAKAPAPKKAPAAAKAAATVPPVEPTPATTTAPAAALAPAGWYPVAAGSPQQRWWDGAKWTEHVYGPTTPAAVPVASQATAVPQPAAAQTSPVDLTAPAGTKPGTVWFWLLAVGVPVLTLLDLIPTAIYLSQLIGGDTSDPATVAANAFSPGYLLVFLSGWFIYAVCIVFALLDWRALKARGVPKPFHWAWSFIVIAAGWPAVYMIGRSVVVKRRTGRGLAPLWVFVGLEVAVFIASLVVIITAIAEFVNVFSSSLSNAGNVF